MDNLAQGIEKLTIAHTSRRQGHKQRDSQKDVETQASCDRNKHGQTLGFFSANWQTLDTHSQRKPAPQQQHVDIKPRSNHRMVTRSQRKIDKPRPYIKEAKQFLLKRPRSTSAYMTLANVPSRRLQIPQPLLIILDLNGTLVRKTNGSNFVKRLLVVEFLKYVVANHTVMIWSSARPETVRDRCSKLFAEAALPVPALVWDRSHFGLSKDQYNRNTQLYKELWKVWQHPQVKAVSGDVTFDQTNTILIDDTEEKAAAEPYNLLKIDEFVHGKEEFGELGQVVAYLEQAKCQSNVSAYLKDTPFVLDPAAASYDWEILKATAGIEEEGSLDQDVDQNDDYGGVKLVTN